MFAKFLRPLLVALLALLSWLPAPASAQSACTAIWGVIDNDGAGAGANFSLRYFNQSTSRWVTVTSANVTGAANAMGSDSTTGLIYYLNRTASPAVLRSYNLNTNVDTLIGNLAPPLAPATGTNALGATFDSSGRFFVYATQGGTNTFAVVAQISLATGNTLTSWTQVRTTAGATPTISGSGDIYFDKAGQGYILTNTVPPQRHAIDLDPAGGSFGQTISPSQVVTGAPVTPWGIAQDPVGGTVYFGTNNGGSATYSLSAGGAATLVDNSAYTLGDMGNCVQTPAVPTITKTFTPAISANATTTVNLTFGNTNLVPFWLETDFTDTLPTSPGAMVLHSTPSVQGSCVTPGNVVTATPGAGSLTLAAGARIPAGGCTLSFVVTTPALGDYVNSIPAGALVTTAGSNSVPASATFTRAVSDFSMDKQQREGTTGAFTTATVSVGGSQTLQYQLTITNSAGSVTGSATFTDTLPALVTPVLAITATQTGGGSCTTATAVVGGRTQITGTLTAAPAGAFCVVTVTARGSTTAAVTSTQNTATVASLGDLGDSDPTNNDATVTTTIGRTVDFTVLKEQREGTAGAFGTADISVSAGQTLQYQLTIANSASSLFTSTGAFTDTLPQLVTPVLSITALQTGGGSCTTATAVVGGRTQLTGTMTAAPPGAFCVVTVTARGSTTATPANALNTVTVAPADGLLEATPTDNMATVTTSIGAFVDFTLAKAQRDGTVGVFTTDTVSIGSSQTIQYQLTITNDIFSTASGSATFTDTLPQLITPVLSVTALQTGGGACTTATAVVGGRTRVRGTMTAAPPGAFCVVTVTARASATAAVSTFLNTATLAALGVTELDTTNNRATVTTTIGPLIDITVVKEQRAGSSGPFTTATTLIGATQTVQYQITIANDAFSTVNGSSTFTDTLPQLITPVLSVTALQTGGGGCTTVTSVVGGRTQIRGTMTAAPPGAFCVVTVTARGSNTAVLTSAQNTVTAAPTAGLTDFDVTNNRATVTTTVTPLIANLQIAKTNGVTQLFTGQTTSYTVTVSNLGPSAAPGTTLLDPAAAGLNCTTVTFVSTPLGSVTTSPSPLTLAALQSTGIQLTPTFPANSTATFNVTCGVTATGL